MGSQDTRPARLRWALAAAGAAIIVIAYLPLWRAGFIWDDDSLVTADRLVKAGDGLHRIWFTTQAPDYWPVTYSVFWLEWHLWGPHALGYHLTNLALHLVDVGLLWAVLRRLRIPGAGWAALLMGVHPLNVESVAWIAQCKNLLAMLFFLASVRAFLETGLAASPGAPGSVTRRQAAGWYAASLGCFALAMLSKGSAVTLPVVLAGIMAWYRRRTARDWIRLAPFAAVAVVLAAVEIRFQHQGAPEIIREAGVLTRLLGAAAAVGFYLYHAFWPASLSFVYPQWNINPANPLWWLPLTAVLALTALLFWPVRRRPILFSWGYFCLALLPVAGFVDVYFLKYSLVADHYAHFALIGAVAWAAFTGHALWSRSGRTGRTGWMAAAVVAVGLLAARTWIRCLDFRDTLTLFRQAEQHNPESWMVHATLGREWLLTPGHLDAAIAELQEALRLNPRYALAHENLGNAWSQVPGRLDDAVAEYREALRLQPELAIVHESLGNVWARTPGRLDDAIAEYQAALRLEDDLAEAHNNLGYLWSNLPGRLGDAIPQLQQALLLNPDFAEAHNNLGNAWAQTPGRLADAVAEYQAALRLRPGYPEAQHNLDVVLQLQRSTPQGFQNVPPMK